MTAEGNRAETSTVDRPPCWNQTWRRHDQGDAQRACLWWGIPEAQREDALCLALGKISARPKELALCQADVGGGAPQPGRKPKAFDGGMIPAEKSAGIPRTGRKRMWDPSFRDGGSKPGGRTGPWRQCWQSIPLVTLRTVVGRFSRHSVCRDAPWINPSGRRSCTGSKTFSSWSRS
jgi:hypothetical protein